MKKQEQYQQIIARNVPHLVNLLLDSKQEGEKHAKYDECLNYGTYMLTNYNRPSSSPESVLRNMDDFVERFHLEHLEEVGETVKMLGQVVVDDQHCPEDLKYSVLEFMLSVNFKAFRTARINIKEIMTRRSNLLEALATAYKQREEAINSIVRDYKSPSLRRPLDLEIEVSSIGNNSLSDSMDLSLDLSLDLSIGSSHDSVSSTTEQQQVVDDGLGLLNQLDDQDARQSFSIALSQLQQLQEQVNQDNECGSSLQLNEPRPFGSFALSFADYLRRPLQDVNLAMLQFGEEGFLLRELLTMFFQPRDCRYFEVVNHLIQLRANANSNNLFNIQLLQQFIKPLQYMQLLHLFIDCYENHIETLTSLTAAFRRLLKPVVESLTHFEQRMATGKGQATLCFLLRATKQSFKRLLLLWNLAAASYVLHPQQQCVAPHFRSHHTISNLLKLTMRSSKPEKEVFRGSAAALLVHVLQVYCQFLDSWWQLGDFQDWHEEFPAMRMEIKGLTEYGMRVPEKGEPSMGNCRLYQIIEEHVKSAGHSLAMLYDCKRLDNFVSIHRSLLKKSLHHAFVNCLLHQLKPYKVVPAKKTPTAPDIFRQLKSTENEQMRSLYYAYYKESLLDFKQPTICTIDELMKQCQNCASYTPFHELICLSFERVLEPRVLLVNSFVVHLLRVEFELEKVLAHLRSVYLLTNFQLFGEQFEAALDQLNQGLISEATEQLQSIVNRHNPLCGCPFRVILPNVDLDQLSLLHSFDPALACIINEPQLELYNIAFRRLLQLHVAIRKLQQLPELPCDSATVARLVTLKRDLELALKQHLKSEELQLLEAECDAELQRCVSLPQLQQVHSVFVHQMSVNLLEGNDGNLQELLMLATIVVKHWKRLQRVLIKPTKCCSLADFEAHYAKLNNRYLLSINKLSESMQCLLSWPKAGEQ